MTAKEAKVVREAVLAKVEEVLEIEGFEMVGRTSEGVAFESVETGDSLVVRTIVKAEGTDIRALVQEFTAKQEKAEKEKAEKEKKVAKAKKEKE